MVIQQVDKRLLSELEAMGFSEAQARKALHHSGKLVFEKMHAYIFVWTHL